MRENNEKHTHTNIDNMKLEFESCCNLYHKMSNNTSSQHKESNILRKLCNHTSHPSYLHNIIEKMKAPLTTQAYCIHL